MYIFYKSDNNIDVKSNILNLPIKISVNYNRGLFLKNYFSWINAKKPVNFYWFTGFFSYYLWFFNQVIALYVCIAAPVTKTSSLNTTLVLCIGSPYKGFSFLAPAPNIKYKLGTS